MAEDLEEFLEFNSAKSVPNSFGFAEYGLNSAQVIDHISAITRKCEELYYKNIRS